VIRIIRRASGSVMTWRRAQMVLLSAQGMDAAAIAKVAFAQVLCWESRRSRRVDGRGVALGQGPQLTPRRPKSRRTLRLAQIAVDASAGRTETFFGPAQERCNASSWRR
jgi:hypothetical protein